MTIVDDFNRTEIQRKFVDYLIGKMDFMEIKRELWNCINQEKNKYSNYSLELEISRDAPKILGDLVSGTLHLNNGNVGQVCEAPQTPNITSSYKTPSKKTKNKPKVLAGGLLWDILIEW